MFESANRKEDLEDIMNKTDEVKLIQDSQRSIWTTWKISVKILSGTACMVLQAMAMLGQGGIGEAIMNKILRAATANGGVTIEAMFRNVIKKELMHGSSLIWCDEGERQGACMFKMHRLVQRFILNDMVRGSAISLTLRAVREVVKTELEKEGNSFCELPDVFENSHRELSTYTLALVHHYMLPAPARDLQDVSELEDFHWYTGKGTEFMGNWEEEVQAWDHLLIILHHQQTEKQRRRLSVCLVDARYRRNQEKKEKIRIVGVYCNMGFALRRIGKLDSAASKHEQGLEIRRAIYGYGKPHPVIASSLNSLGNVYLQMEKMDKALENHEQSLEMKRAIYRNGKPHPEIAPSLNNLGLVYEGMNKLNEALEKHKQSLGMYLAIHGHNKPHPLIASSLNNLGNIYFRMNKLDKALKKHKQSLDMYLTIQGHGNPHPDIATSLNNLGNVYHRMGKGNKAQEKHEQSRKMRRAVHVQGELYPDIGKSPQSKKVPVPNKGVRLYLRRDGRSSQAADILKYLKDSDSVDTRPRLFINIATLLTGAFFT